MTVGSAELATPLEAALHSEGLRLCSTDVAQCDKPSVYAVTAQSAFDELRAPRELDCDFAARCWIEYLQISQADSVSS